MEDCYPIKNEKELIEVCRRYPNIILGFISTDSVNSKLQKIIVGLNDKIKSLEANRSDKLISKLNDKITEANRSDELIRKLNDKIKTLEADKIMEANRSDRTDKLSKENAELHDKIKSLEQNISKLMITKNNMKIGISSSNAGIHSEESLVILLKEHFDSFEIDRTNKNKMMDITMQKDDMIIGIESKYKTKLTKLDLSKFDRDRLSNGFHGSVFISLNCPIKGLVDKCNKFLIKNDVLYIYSDDGRLITSLIELYISYLTTTSTNNRYVSVFDDFVYTYELWSGIKKKFNEFDTYYAERVDKYKKMLTV